MRCSQHDGPDGTPMGSNHCAQNDDRCQHAHIHALPIRRSITVGRSSVIGRGWIDQGGAPLDDWAPDR